jgi:hypothetical protein
LIPSFGELFHNAAADETGATGHHHSRTFPLVHRHTLRHKACLRFAPQGRYPA